MKYFKTCTIFILILVSFFNTPLLFADLTEGKTKLKFSEHGPFFGIKENGLRVRGIYKLRGNESVQTDFYGLFTKDDMIWKGYSKHTYNDGRIIYHYNEYQLDSEGRAIQLDDEGNRVFKNGIFQIVDSYVITADDFEKVKKYINYDIPIPFSFYDFDLAGNNQEKQKNKTDKAKLKIPKINIDHLNDTIKKLKLNTPLVFELDKIEEKTNIRVEIEKTKQSFIGADGQKISLNLTNTNFLFIDKNNSQREYNVATNDKYPDYTIYNLNFLSDVYRYEENIPKEFKPADIGSDVSQRNLLQVSLGTYSNDIVTANSPNPLTDIIHSEKMASISIKLMNKEIRKEEALDEALKYLKNKFDYFNYIDGRIDSHLTKDEKNDYFNFSLVNFENGNFNGICSDTNKYNYFFKNNFEERNCQEIYLNKLKWLNIYSIFMDLESLQSRLEAKLNKSIENQFETDEKYYALVIGNNNYKFLEKLDAAENDAAVIADVLKKKYGFKVDLLLNADYDTTVDSLFNITNKLKKDDNLLIYYAGHGEIDKAEDRGYWLPIDASYEKRSKWISNQRIVDRIKATKAKHVLLIADSCFSGTLMRSGSLTNDMDNIDEKYIERLKKKKTRLVITSGGNEPVVDSVGGDHSLFALKLIETLRDNNNVINSQILFENIRRYVVANADQTPERAQVHKTGHDGGDFLFFPKE